MLKLFPPGTRGAKTWLARGRLNGRVISRVTGCESEEEAKVWLDRFLDHRPRHRIAVPKHRYPVDLEGRTAAEFREAEKLQDCLARTFADLNKIDHALARRGIIDLRGISTQLDNLRSYIADLSHVLEIEPP
jgi:hypothetical protein